IGAGLDGGEFVVPLGVADAAPDAGKIRIDRGGVLIPLMAIASRGIGLPDFHQAMRDRAPRFVPDLAFDDDALALRLALMLAGEIGIARRDTVMTEERAGELRQGLGNGNRTLRGRAAARAAIGRMEKRRMCRQTRPAVFVLHFHLCLRSGAGPKLSAGRRLSIAAPGEQDPP